MESGNRWIVKGRATGAQDKTIIDHIMLRYRPIAPKPVADGSVPGSTPVTNKSELITKPRKKRKYVRVKKTRRCKVGKEKESKDVELGENIVSLQLQTEVSGSNGLTASGSSINLDFTVKKMPFWLNFNKSENNEVFLTGRLSDQVDRTAVVQSVRVVETWAMVDGITDTWLDKRGLGSTDMEKMKNLELDSSCPGLISDEFDRVQWVNLAYKNMVDPPRGDDDVGGGGGGVPAEVVVWLVVKDKIPVFREAFACSVRVVYTYRNEKHSQTMPCDVWKMDFGGFAWRLDAKAALSLGR